MATTTVEPGNATLTLATFAGAPAHTISLTLTNDQWEDFGTAAFGHYSLSQRNALIMFIRDLVLDFYRRQAAQGLDYEDVIGDIT